jgi:hypothetical protein
MTAHAGGLVTGVGLGLRPEICTDLLLSPRSVDFVEVVVEACFAQIEARREAVALSEMWPVIPHGIKLSLGSAEGIEIDRARRLGALARELKAPLISEHVAFVRGGTREIGHLTALPQTREAVRIVARNVARARRHLPDVPLLLENIAWTFRWPDDDMSEADFYAEVVEATGCDLLLDLSNLYANARNAGQDPLAVLRAFPLERVAMVHLAGGIEDGGFYFDTHAHAVPPIAFELLEVLAERRGQVPVVIERDALFPAFSELQGEIDRAREAQRSGQGAVRARQAPAADEPAVDARWAAELLARQESLAVALTAQGEPGPDLIAAHGAAALRRSREVLKNKRVDDAMPLLPRLMRRRGLIEPVARRCVFGAPRAPSRSAIADAIRIARAAREVPALEEDARRDALALDARFVLDGVEVRPRQGLFLRRERLQSGASVWAFKGPGGAARVRIYEGAA